MTNLRCTAKLLKRFGVERPPDPPPGDNALGDWYANILFVPGAHLLLCVSERSRLPVVAPARGLRDFPAHFPRHLRDVLLAIGVPVKAVDWECGRMGELAFGPTKSRSILGTLNDFASMLRLSLDKRPSFTLLDWSVHLADTPCSPLGWRQPKEVARELLGGSARLRVIEGGRS